MEQLKPEQISAVWSRVLQGRQTATEEQTLQAWISGCEALRRSYHAMASQARHDGGVLRQMEAEQASQQRSLVVLYYLLYGSKPRTFSAAAEGKRSYPAALRGCYAAEHEAAEQWQRAAQESEEHRDLFLQLRQTALEHQRRLRLLTQRALSL